MRRVYSVAVGALVTGRWWGITERGPAVEVRVPRPVEHLLEQRWPPVGLLRSHVEPADVRLTIEVRIDWEHGSTQVVVDGVEAGGGWERVESDLALFAAEHLAESVAVHAAVLVHRGRAILVPGVSGVGKSTLSVAAVAAGVAVLTDEYALVHPTTGLVTGWRRPVRLRRPGGVIERLDLAVESPPVPVGLVALVRFERGAVDQWADITAADAVLGLMANTVCARSRPDESFDAALAIARGARAVSGVRGEAEVAIAELVALLDRAG